MKNEHSAREEEILKAVEIEYERILLGDLINRYHRLRIRSYFNAYNYLLAHWLEAFDEQGMICSGELTGFSEGYDRGYLVDDIGTAYFCPVTTNQMLEGEEVICRVLHYYHLKDRAGRVAVMRELLSDYRELYKKPHESRSYSTPGQSAKTAS